MLPNSKSEFAALPSMKLIKPKELVINPTIRKFKISQLAKIEKSDISCVRFNWNTYPGFKYSEYLGQFTKGAALDFAKYIAEKRWDNIRRKSLKGEMV